MNKYYSVEMIPADFSIRFEQGRTDNASATDFVNQNQCDIRYVPLWGKFLAWDRTRFQVDYSQCKAQGLVRRWAEKLWLEYLELAQDGTVDRDELNAVRGYVLRRNRLNGIDAVLRLARSDKRICIDHVDLDSDPLLFNCKNGTYDLERHRFRPHNQTDLITQRANVKYDVDADCPQWRDTLKMIFNGDLAMIAYLQRILGYCLTGLVGEPILPIWYGAGCNGKSTIWNVILELFGDYATIASDTLLKQQKTDQHSTEKADLFRRRFVAIPEPAHGMRLNESRVKELTGDRKVTARRMREDNWTFDRTHKFIMATNYKPRITGTDEGIWRRIKLVPFETDIRQAVEEVEPDFDRVLFDSEAPGILNWLIEGLIQYQCSKAFGEPEKVTAATSEYRVESDHVGQFIDENLEEGEGAVLTAKDAFELYKNWAGDRHMNQTNFGREMATRLTKEKPTSGEYRRKVIYLNVKRIL